MQCVKQISLKLGVTTVLTNQINWLSTGGDPVPDCHIHIPDHFLNFPHHCEIWDFRRFISIFHAVTGRFL